MIYCMAVIIRFFRDFLNRFGYYDIFIVDANTGRIVYSVFKEVDYATSLFSGPYADSGIGKAFKQALRLEDTNHSVLIDFAQYQPSYDQAASFIASPIADTTGQVDAVLIFQMPIDGINHTMTNEQQWKNVGLGLTGETYLVGPDKLLRSESRVLIEDSTRYFQLMNDANAQPNLAKIRADQSALGLQVVDTAGVDAALEGKQGIDRYVNYRGIEVFSAYSYIDFGNQRWAILASIDADEALHDGYQLSSDLYSYMSISIGVIGMISLMVGIVCANHLVKPINLLVERLKDISSGDGDLTATLTLAERDDEIGEVGRAFNQFVAKIKDIIVSIDNHATQLSASAEELSTVSRQTNQIVELQKHKTCEVTALITTFSQSMKEIAHNSVDTEALTDDASGESAKGGTVV